MLHDIVTDGAMVRWWLFFAVLTFGGLVAVLRPIDDFPLIAGLAMLLVGGVGLAVFVYGLTAPPDDQ